MLGAAGIADSAVLPAITASRNGRAVAIASRTADRARELATHHQIERVLPDYEAVLADPDVDAVYIPLPNNLHCEWTLRALAAGKHVLCEKPIGMSSEEAEEMAAASADSGLQVMEAFMYRFHPRTRAFVERVRAGERPVHVQAGFGFTLKKPDDYRFRRHLGGGSLLDVGCYAVSVSRWLLGEPDTVLALGRVDPVTDVDMSVTAVLGYEDGASAAVWCSFESAEAQGLTVVTHNESLSLEKPFSSHRDPEDHYQLMVESFGDSVLERKPVAISMEESIANMRVLDRIREAARI